MIRTSYLAFNQHCHIGEHFPQFLNTAFELNDVFMPGLYISQRLLGLL